MNVSKWTLEDNSNFFAVAEDTQLEHDSLNFIMSSVKNESGTE